MKENPSTVSVDFDTAAIKKFKQKYSDKPSTSPKAKLKRTPIKSEFDQSKELDVPYYLMKKNAFKR